MKSAVAKTTQASLGPEIPIGGFVSRYSSAMAGDANDAEVPKISRSITCSREAIWEAMWKKISSPFAARAIGKAISVSRL